MIDTLLVKNLGTINYQSSLEMMQSFTKVRTKDTQDELWLLQRKSL